tara:strand:+ start:222 stop:449 length:228 start_codon:yes stop_codon:yes gene_type:complete
MDFFTALVLVYQIKSEETATMIWFNNYESCYEAQYATDKLYNLVNGTEMYCVESDVASRIVKPKPRPKVQSEERL